MSYRGPRGAGTFTHKDDQSRRQNDTSMRSVLRDRNLTWGALTADEQPADIFPEMLCNSRRHVVLLERAIDRRGKGGYSRRDEMAACTHRILGLQVDFKFF